MTPLLLPCFHRDHERSLISLVSLVPPELIMGTDSVTNITVSLHAPLMLICEASGIPPPAATWFREDAPVVPGEWLHLLSGEQ